MFHLNVSLHLKEGELERFLEFVKSVSGVKSGVSPPDFHGWNSHRLAWIKLESQFLNAAKLAEVLHTAGFVTHVFDSFEHEPREQVS